MKKWIAISTVLATSLFLFSCPPEDPERLDTCTLTNKNQIRNLKKNGDVSAMMMKVMLTNQLINFKFTYSTTSYQFDQKINQYSPTLKNENGTSTADIILYHPEDSSDFNNRNYLNTYYIRDYNSPQNSNSEILASGCAFNFHIRIQTPDGSVLQSSDQNNLSKHFFQIDKIEYVPRVDLEYAQFNVFGHFKTTLVNIANQEKEDVSGNMIILMTTDKE